MKKFLNKRGMTYVELLVAFTLLMLIVVAFTPMLLRSYEAVYSAGEKSANLYYARTKLEDGLATRRSADTENVTLNFSDYIGETRIVGRRIPATTEAMLETLFYGAHSTIEIISPKHVPDDTTSYQVILQATNIPVTFDSVNGKTKADVEAAEASKTKDDNNVVALIAKAPVKTTSSGDDTTTEDAAYDTKGFTLNMTVDAVDADSGKITITLKAPSGKTLDFTTSPIRIQAYYINERGIMKSVSDYLYIDPMTILIGGQTSTGGFDYFTTAGVSKKLGSSTATFVVEGRNMPLSNSNSAYAVSPKSNQVSFTTATWIDNDVENELGPYYVMTGTDGYIYRMYNFTHNGDLYKSTAAQVGNGSSRKATTDGFMSLKSGAVVYPSFWSGDYTDWYSFQTAYKSNTYGVDQTDNNFDCSFLTRYNTEADSYSNRAHYSMVFSGYKTGYNYLTARGRRLSYTLSEHGLQTFRLAGKLASDSDYKGFNARWETNAYQGPGGSAAYKTKVLGISVTRHDPGVEGESRPVYFTTQKWSLSNWDWSTNDVYDKNYSPIYLKSFTSIPPTALESVKTSEFKGAFWCPWGNDADFNDDYGYNTNAGQNKDEASARNNVRNTNTIAANGEVRDEWGNMADWVSSKYATNVNLTSAAYIPVKTGDSTSGGQLVYFGTVPSYGLIMQHDAKNNTNSDYYTPGTVWNCDRNGDLPGTAYYVDGTAESGTNIYRYSGSTGRQVIHHPAFEGNEIPAEYANWIPAVQANWIPAQYANPIPAQYATWFSKPWIYSTWTGGAAHPTLVKVYCECYKGKKYGAWFSGRYLHFYPVNADGSINRSIQLEDDRNYMESDGDFWYIYARSGNASDAANYNDYYNYVQIHETPGSPLATGSFDVSYKQSCSEKGDGDKFPEGARSYGSGVYIYVIKIGYDSIETQGHWSSVAGNYWVNSSGQQVTCRTDQPGNGQGGQPAGWDDHNMIAGTGPGCWDRTDVNTSTGLVNGTNCWDRPDVNQSTGIVNGTNCWDRTDCDPTTGLINGTGPGNYYPGEEPYAAYDEIKEDGDEVDSGVIQSGLKSSIGAKAAPDTSHNTNNLFYNTFRDKKTYLYNDTNLEFTLGYCSNWLIGAGTVVIQTAAEMQSSATDSSAVAKSFEKFYTRSNPSATQGNSTKTNNLFYDTWFPGEYYNLTQTASLDGVTVACGYTVAGAAFEAQPVKKSNGDPIADDNGNLRYSTALGGIYNDAVLSIYDNTKTIATGTGNYVNGGFRNLLYYKSNVGFDNTTHNRQSVRFTAVDLMSQRSGDNLDYYAFYGDNLGNVYRSKVATASGSATVDAEGNVTGAGDAQLNLATNITYGEMLPVTVGGTTAFNGTQALSTVFTEIEKITCGNNLVVITGKCSGNTAKAVVVYRERTGVDNNPSSATYGQETYSDWKTKVVSLGGGHINDAIVLGDYYYAVGCDSVNTRGKIWAVKLSALVNYDASASTDGPTMMTVNKASNGTFLPVLTCVAGRSTGVNRADDASA